MMKTKISKKGAVSSLLISFGFLAAIAIFFYFFTTTQPIKNYIGESQMQLLIQAKQAEKAQNYIEQSAKFAILQSIYDLTNNSSNCSTYYGFSLWLNQTTNCMPSQQTIINNFKNLINERLNSYFEVYEDVTLPTNNYDFLITPSKLKVLGVAKNDLVISTMSSYINVLITAYYVPSEKDFGNNWYSGEDYKKYSGYEIYSWCVIPPSKRGFYEEVKCEGSGVSATGKEVYNYKTIQPTKAASKTVDKIYTATGTEAKAHRTIAVAPNMIPYGSRVEIKFTDCTDVECCKQWEGEYIAEDTGIAMVKDWERGIPHIDVFAGIGKEEYAKAKCISGKHADIIVKSDKIEGKGSSYKIKPNFKAEFDYDLEEYEKLKEELNILLKEIKDRGCIIELPDTKCIKNVLSKYNEDKKGKFYWDYNCVDEEQRIFYDLIERFELCTKDGICNIPKPETENEYGLEYEISFYRKDNKIIAKSKNNEYETRLLDLGATKSSLNEIEKCTRLIFKISKDKVKITGECTSFKPDFEYKTNNVFTYVYGNVAYILNPNKMIKEEIEKYKPETPKGLLKLCAFSKYRNYFYDEYDKMTKERNLVYRIAAFSGDLEAPLPVQNVRVFDTKKAENNGTIIFDENKDEKDVDVSHYNVYYSENMFDNVKNAKFLISIKDDNDPDKNGYNTTFKLEDGTYYFAVTAVDTSGNENKTVTPVKATLIDDFNPGPAKLNLEKTKTGKILFTITRPYQNEDGTDINEGQIKKYLIYKFYPADNQCRLENIGDFSSSNLFFMLPWSGSEKMEEERTPIENNVCYVVIADDDQEEEIKKEDQGKRFNQESIYGPI